MFIGHVQTHCKNMNILKNQSPDETVTSCSSLIIRKGRKYLALLNTDKQEVGEGGGIQGCLCGWVDILDLKKTWALDLWKYSLFSLSWGLWKEPSYNYLHVHNKNHNIWHLGYSYAGSLLSGLHSKNWDGIII